MCEHVVLFYEDNYPAEKVGDFFAAGLDAGDSCLALLTEPHRRAVERCLQARGVRTDNSAYVAVDTHEALAQMLVDGRLDMRRASDLLTPLMIPPANGGTHRVRVVGDLPATLCAAGNTDDAVAFEGLVHRVTMEHGASVICAYPIQTVGRRGTLDAMFKLIAEHAAIQFPERLWVQGLMPSAP